MKTIRISDITMKQGAQTGKYALTFREKLEVSKLLDRLGVSVIELEGIHQTKIDSLRIKSIAAIVKNSIVAVPVSLCEEQVQLVWTALKEACHPRLQVAAPVSPVQMEYLAHKKSSAMLTDAQRTIEACKKLTEDVEFVADDATRSDPEFLYRMIRMAIGAGAKLITVCDTAGAMLPSEFSTFLDELYEHVPELKQVELGVSCSDELSMADACAIAAVCHGAVEIKAAAYRVNTVSLANLTKLLASKEDLCGARCTVRTTELKRGLNQIDWMCQTSRSKLSPFDNGVGQSDNELALTCHDDRAAVDKAVEGLGYDLSEEDRTRVWEAFQRMAVHKKKVGARELDAIVASAAMQVPDIYRLESYTVNTDNVMGATAHIKVRYKDQILDGLSAGDGPVDASFLAIEQITGCHYELDDFQIQAVTEGREAMGETVVKLRYNGKLYSGRGLSTDISASSMLAYINAVNKIVYEEEMA